MQPIEPCADLDIMMPIGWMVELDFLSMLLLPLGLSMPSQGSDLAPVLFNVSCASKWTSMLKLYFPGGAKLFLVVHCIRLVNERNPPRIEASAPRFAAIEHPNYTSSCQAGSRLQLAQ